MVNTKSILSIISVLIVLFLALSPHKVHAQNIMFSDDFESGITSAWKVIHGNWSVATDPNYPENGLWLDGNSQSFTDNEIQAGDFTWKNYNFSFDILPKIGVDRNIFFRVTNTRTPVLTGHDMPVSYSLQPTGGLTYLSKWTSSGFGGLPQSSVVIPSDKKSHFSIDVYEQNIKVYLNNSQILEYTDNDNPISSGRIALGMITGYDPSRVLFDNVIVTNLSSPSPTPTVTPTPVPTPTPTPSELPISTATASPTPLPNLSVPDLKQYSQPWADHLYDSAKLWSNNPTIRRWGCALTSASMVLKFYNHNINPDSLNTWLNTQPDGYIGNGLVNWLAISRYTLEHSSSSAPALEYRKLEGTFQNLIDELISGRPSILNVTGHFVVAKSQTNTSFGINDPAFSNRTILESYSNTVSSIGSYRPTHTDLSYILLTTTKNTSLNISGPDGNTINEYLYTEKPLKDDVGGKEINGDTLKIFLFPTPPLGNYKVEVSGNGEYGFDSYLYDKFGKVSAFSKSGILSQNQKDVINLTISSINLTKPDIDIKVLIRDIDNIYKQKLIKNKHIYESLKGRLLLIKWAIERNKKVLAKNLLHAFRLEIIWIRPTFIDYSAKKILLEDVSFLMSQL